MSSAINKRLFQLAAQFDGLHIDAFLVTNSANVRYLTQYKAEAAWLLVTSRKAYYLTDARFSLEAKKGLRQTPVLEAPHPFLEPIRRVLQKEGAGVLGFDENAMSVATFKKVRAGLSHVVRLKACNQLIDKLRQIKDKEETLKIREALKINLAMMRYAGSILRPGMTEQQVLNKLAGFVEKHKAGFAFDSIIASGPHSACPHARVTDRRLRKGEPVLIDAGIDMNGYKSDLTRMFFLGKMTTSFRNIYQAVASAQELAFRKIRPGIKAAEVDLAARNFLEKKGLARYFSHSLGHGVGLEVHEEPRISSKSTTRLRPGMIFTVEPGVYLADRFGVRVEDMILVTDSGYEVLSRG